ncbi:hypothetical protein F0562_019658 [Nyssa sinensis]|uniref:Uncharacterized protein n=1 Tax=Nyssa sinensis TaxID=561372 RepID=A0A5J5BT46_9ASTE|nr:hypothetical protein F0562_019658 [Nyssa sinensis]
MLGYSPPSSVPKTPLKNSDVDFHDVFRGPPRRYSIHEMQHRYSETMDSSTGLSEKPVFGEESENHRRYTSDDFFNDIFRGGGSPRSPSRDPCCSAPASRVMQNYSNLAANECRHTRTNITRKYCFCCLSLMIANGTNAFLPN